MAIARRPIFDPFGLAPKVAERYGLDINQILRIDHTVDPREAPTVTVKLIWLDDPEPTDA